MVVIDMDRLVYGEEAVKNLENIVKFYPQVAKSQEPEYFEIDEDRVAAEVDTSKFGTDWQHDVLTLDMPVRTPEMDVSRVIVQDDRYVSPGHKAWAQYLGYFKDNWARGRAKQEQMGDQALTARTRAEDPFFGEVTRAQEDYLVSVLSSAAGTKSDQKDALSLGGGEQKIPTRAQMSKGLRN